jgi:hypothetical protein
MEEVCGGFMNPEKFDEALHIVMMGALAAIIALAVSVIFPSIIPARATQVKL